MKTPTILVIDDDQGMRESCSRIFAGSEYHVSTAGDGASGLKQVRELKPDVDLIDLNMPGRNGIEVLEEIKEIDPTIVPIVITGYPSTENAVAAMKRGAYDFVPKPFTPKELRSITQRGLETRRQALESAAVRHQKEEAKELLVSIVSHQLRSPLTAVQGYFELILGDFVTDPLEQRRIIEQMRTRIHALLEMINDWLKMAEVDGATLRKNFESLDLAAVLIETVDFMKPLAKAKVVSLRLEIPDDQLFVRGNKELLQEVFTNLIDNGIKYNRHGGKVVVSTRYSGKHLFVDVSDTGIGITKTDIPFVFDEFFRAKSEATRQIAGTGLGLAIAKRMVDAHSGAIEVTSQPGKGSVFTVTLPRLHTGAAGRLRKEGAKWKRRSES